MNAAPQLREVQAGDLPIFFEHQSDPLAWHMAAFGAKDPSDAQAFFTHWSWLLANPAIVKRTVVVQSEVVGHVLCFDEAGRREVSYWIDKGSWGRGFASEALAQFLREIAVRPLFARAAKDNVASLRVLQKNGFQVCGEDRGHAEARGCEIDEFILTLPAA